MSEIDRRKAATTSARAKARTNVALLATLALAGGTALAFAVGSGPALGQIVADETIYACTSQQELEQTVQSSGSIVPDGCRTLTVESLISDTEALCLLNFAAGDEDLLGQLQEAATPSEWWVRCDALAAALAS
ncbi:MAG TPA: hypothetical protein VGN80_00315 [Devosiaceae bacterium]|jgi:hypothetical protein|nr:hypothetical protein [Devosiaceae bacterium]